MKNSTDPFTFLINLYSGYSEVASDKSLQICSWATIAVCALMLYGAQQQRSALEAELKSSNAPIICPEP